VLTGVNRRGDLQPLGISNCHSSGLCAVSEQKIFFKKFWNLNYYLDICLNIQTSNYWHEHNI